MATDATAKPVILVVDDEPACIALAEVNLQLAGFQVVQALDGLTGLTMAEQCQPDLVILDMLMPVMDGWGTLSALRSHERFAETPITMLTCISSPRDPATADRPPRFPPLA